MNVTIHGVTSGYDGFFKITKLDTEHEKYDGGTIRKTWEVFERGDAVAVVLYKKDTQEIVLVRQFRAPTLHYTKGKAGYSTLNDGQLDETIAGMPSPPESHVDCAVREVYEETGYRVRPEQLELISQFYASPGGTSERIFLYYAEVTTSDREATASASDGVAGNSRENENILVRHVPVSEFLAGVLNPKGPIDSKVLIASMLLRERLRGNIPTAKSQAAHPQRISFDVDGRPGFSVVLRTGDIRSITDVDAWINSENTDMEMDRFVGRTISALIRYEGAAKDAQGRVIEDTIADALRKAMRGRFTSNIGTVHDTTSGDLKQKNNVKRLFHVASVRGVVNKGIFANPAEIEMVTRRALEAVDRRNGLFTASCTSALVPLIGTGDSNLTVEVAFPEILGGVLSFFDANRQTRVTAVHLSVFSQHDAEFAITHLDRHARLKRSA